jgi:L-amino acid N-acyltransferase YncA
MAPLQVRRAAPSDLAGLRQLSLEASRAALSPVHRDPVDVGEWGALRVPVVVMSDGIAPVGFAAALPRNVPCAALRCAEVLVYVNAAHRRRGAGRAAMSELLTAARAAGLWKLVAYTAPDDADQRALLARFEFREVGVFVKHAQLDGAWRDVAVHERLIMAARRSLPSINGG